MVNMSKVETVRKALITQTVFLVIITAVCGALSFATNKFLNIQVAKKGKIESSIKSMDRSIRDKSETYNTSQDEIEIYSQDLKLDKKVGYIKDVFGVQDLIRLLKPTVDEVKNTVPYINFGVKVSPPLTKNKDGNKAVKYIESKVSFSFEAMTDEVVLNFIDMLSKKLNGYMILESLTMNREEANARSGFYVRGDLIFSWNFLKKI